MIDRPRVYINLKNIRKEKESKVPFKKKGWQDALQSAYPFKINLFRVRDGELTYMDEGPYKPLHTSRIDMYASNIRNIRFRKEIYPSFIHVEGQIFEKGTLTLEGKANFLEKPHMGFKTDLRLSDMDLGYFEPITNRGNLSVRKVTVSAEGNIEYSPRFTAMNLKNVDIKGVVVDYLHLPQTAEVLNRKE